MQSDFLDASKRHWQDAEQLFESERWANADHLYGLAAECGLKRLMLAFGMPFDTIENAPKRKSDRKHANGIWKRYDTYRSGHHAGTGYVLPAENPFENWDISQRYANQSNFDHQRADSHRSGAIVVQELLGKARREGLI